MHLVSIVFVAFHLFRVFRCIGGIIAMTKDSAFIKRYVEVHFNAVYGVTMPL